MGNCRVFILYSNSLLAEALESLLRGREGIEVIGKEANQQRGLESIKALHPDVVLIDTTDSRLNGTGDIPRLLGERPEAKVLSFSLYDNHIDVYHRHRITATKVEDLFGAIMMT